MTVYSPACRAKRAADARAWRMANKERVMVAKRAWNAANRERIRAASRAWREANKDRLAASKRVWSEANKEKRAAQLRLWKEENRERVSENARTWRDNNRDAKRALIAQRRAAQIARTPTWADRKAIKAIYAEALRLTRDTGLNYHVDHVIPLQGEHVSGLHVETNLQIITATANHQKFNRFD